MSIGDGIAWGCFWIAVAVAFSAIMFASVWDDKE